MPDRHALLPPRHARRAAVGVRLVAGAALVFSLAGCFEYREDVWLYPDHSGRVEAQLRVPRETWEEYQQVQHLEPNHLREQLERMAAGIPGLELTAFHQFETTGNFRATWTFTFGTADTLGGLLRESVVLAHTLLPLPAGVEPAAQPQASVEQLGRLTTVRRRFPAFPSIAADTYVQTALRGKYARFRVHTPEPIAGAPVGAILSDARTAVWEPELRTLVADGMDLRVSYRAPFPVLPVVGLMLGLVAGVCGIWGFAYAHMRRGLPMQVAGPALPALAVPGTAFDETAERHEDSFTDDWTDS